MKRFINMARTNLLWSYRSTKANWIECLADIKLGSLKGWRFALSNRAYLALDWSKWALLLRLALRLRLRNSGRRVWTYKICGARALINRLKSESSRCTSRSLVLQSLREFLEILFKFIVLFLVVLQALLIRLVALIPILKTGWSQRVAHSVVIKSWVFFVYGYERISWRTLC